MCMPSTCSRARPTTSPIRPPSRRRRRWPGCRPRANALGHDEAALPDWAVPYHRSLVETGCGVQNGRDLLSAFIQDATKRRYADWDELMDYCRRSAASVGRVMMEIHGESGHADIEGSDALCNALQVLNHLQDCREDFLVLDRVYVPEPWLRTPAAARDAGGTSGGTGGAAGHRPLPRRHRGPAAPCRGDAALGPPPALPLGVRGDRQAGLGAATQARSGRPPRRSHQGARARPRGPRATRHRRRMVGAAVTLRSRTLPTRSATSPR